MRLQTWQHASGVTTRDAEEKYTAQRRPVRIVYAEEHGSKQDALRRERQIKRWSQQKKEWLVRGDGAALSGNSRRARIRTAFTWSDWLAQRRET